MPGPKPKATVSEAVDIVILLMDRILYVPSGKANSAVNWPKHRQEMLHRICNSNTVKALVCCVCAQISTHAACWNRRWGMPTYKVRSMGPNMDP